MKIDSQELSENLTFTCKQRIDNNPPSNPRIAKNDSMQDNQAKRLREFNLRRCSLWNLSCRRRPQVLLQTPTVPAVTSCLHYHFEEGHLVSHKRGNCCLASDLLNSLDSSVTAAAYSHRKAGKLVRGGSGDQDFRLDWTELKEKWAAPDIYYAQSFLAVMVNRFFKSHNNIPLCLTIKGGTLQQSPGRHIVPLHIERASCC